VIITTKDGQKGTPTVKASYEHGARSGILPVNYMNTKQYLKWFRRAANFTYGQGLGNTFLRAVLIPRYGLANTMKKTPFKTNKAGEPIPAPYYDGDFSALPSTNWVDFNNRVGIQNKYNMIVSGGNDLTTYRIGGGYENLEGHIRTYRYQNYHLNT